MASTHPYISGAGNIAQMIGQLRKSFPATVTADTVKRLGIASNNESYVINVLQFIGVIDAEGKKTPAAAQIFSKHKDEDFSKAISPLVEKAYSSLFELHGQGAWVLSDEDLITFFRQSDQTGDVIGRRQTNTFKVLAGLAGHGEPPAQKQSKLKSTNGVSKERKKVKEPITAPKKVISAGALKEAEREKDFGLTVRIEINLPAGGTKETYDNIFKSIKDNLLNG